MNYAPFETMQSLQTLVYKSCLLLNAERWNDFLGLCDPDAFRYRIENARECQTLGSGSAYVVSRDRHHSRSTAGIQEDWPLWCRATGCNIRKRPGSRAHKDITQSGQQVRFGVGLGNWRSFRDCSRMVHFQCRSHLPLSRERWNPQNADSVCGRRSNRTE